MRRDQRAANVRRMTRRPSNIEVVIDELILRGFPASQRYAIGDALSAELQRLFAESGRGQRITPESHVPAINGGQINIPTRAQPSVIGTQIAEVVHNRLNTPERRRS